VVVNHRGGVTDVDSIDKDNLTLGSEDPTHATHPFDAVLV
jgi:hypothetical protein